MKIIVPLSFGKDSTTLADKMLGSGMQVDYLVFNDTLMEFPEMYKYAEKVKSYFKRKYNKDVHITKPLTTFEEWCFRVIRDKNADKMGWIKGIPQKSDPFCYWRREAKIKPMDKWIKENIDGDYKIAIGYTTNEKHRAQKDEKKFYPLIETFKMSENDCKNYLVDNEMENPLYKFFNRTGCAMCPFQSDRAFNEIYSNFPDVWDFMKSIEKRLFYYESIGMKVINTSWRNGETMEQMEFKYNHKSANLFDFSDEPLKDCFCKI